MGRPRGSSKGISDEARIRRSEILQTATRLFERKGFRATSLREVADALAVSKPVLYHYFRSKDELLEEVYRDVAHDLLEPINQIRDSEQPACEQLGAIVRNHVAYHMSHRAFLTIFWSERKELPDLMLASVRQAERTVGDCVVSILERGVTEGCFRPSLDIELARNSVLGLLTTVYRWGNKASWNAEELATGITRIVFPGLLQPHSHSDPGGGHTGSATAHARPSHSQASVRIGTGKGAR